MLMTISYGGVNMIARTTCMLVLIALSTALAAQSVTSVTPTRNDIDAQQNANVTAGFSIAMNTPGANNFRVRSNLRGWLGGSFSGGGTSSLTFDPTNDLLPGEEIEVVLTTGLQSTGSAPLANSHVWRFRAGATAGPGVFNTAQHATGATSGWDLEFGDLDNDGDLDAVAIDNGQSYILTNDGSGAFTGAALSATYYGSYKCALADIESDGDLDIIVVSSPMSTTSGQWSGQNLIYVNDGSGGFGSTISFGTGSEYSNDVDVGDVDGDGDVDIVVANGAVSDEANDIFLNDGTGNFTRKGFLYIASSTAEVLDITWGIRLADFDGDGDLDVFLANFGFGPVQSWVYLNDGAANFYWMTRVDLGSTAIATAVATADLNGDGHLDVALAHLGQPSASPPTYDRITLLFNNGSGGFGSPIVMSTANTPWGLEPVDVDADGDLDLCVGTESSNAYILLNNSLGQFSGGMSLGTPAHAAAFADVDGDGDLDAGTPDQICINGSNAPIISVTANSSSISSGGTINVNYNDTLAGLNLQIDVDDPNFDDVSLGVQITNIPTQGIQVSEFSSSAAAAPYSLMPTSGVFNQGNVTHQFTLTASDGGEVSVFLFSIVVNSAPAPQLQVFENAPGGVAISHGSAATGGRDFGAILVGTGPTSTLTVIIFNNGTASLDVNSVTLGGTDAPHFVLNTSTTSGSIAANGYTQFTVAFDPQTAGSKTATVEIDHNDASVSNPFTFEITGVGTTPAPVPLIVVKRGGTTIANGGSIDFGSFTIGSSPAPITITIENAGNTDLTVGTPVLAGTDAGRFSIIMNGFNGTVAPSSSTSFHIAYDALVEGPHSAVLSFTHDDTSTANPFGVNLAGTTTAAGNPGSGSGSGSGSSGGGCVAGTGTHTVLLFALLTIAAMAATRTRRRTS